MADNGTNDRRRQDHQKLLIPARLERALDTIREALHRQARLAAAKEAAATKKRADLQLVRKRGA